MRIFQLAKELNVESHEIIDALEDMNIQVKSNLSSVNDDVVAELRELFKPKPKSAVRSSRDAVKKALEEREARERAAAEAARREEERKRAAREAVLSKSTAKRREQRAQREAEKRAQREIEQPVEIPVTPAEPGAPNSPRPP